MIVSCITNEREKGNTKNNNIYSISILDFHAYALPIIIIVHEKKFFIPRILRRRFELIASR